MIFRFRVDASREMLVAALAIHVDTFSGSAEEAEAAIKKMGKNVIKSIASDRIEHNGKDRDYWPEPPNDLWLAAHRRVDELWPDRV